MVYDPNKFKTAPPAIVTFDAVDFADGTGLVNFFGYNEKDSTGETFKLSRTQIFSYDIETADDVELTESSPIKMLDMDFDLGPLNLSKTMIGTADFTIPLRTQNSTTGGGSITTAFIIVKIKRNDVELFSVQSNTITNPNGADLNEFQIMKFSKEITDTHFAQGDTIRITIEVWAGKNNSGAGARVQIAHDPKDRGGTEMTAAKIDSRVLQINLPFATE